VIAHQRVVSFAKYSFRIAVESKEAMILELGVKCTVTGEVTNCSVERDKYLAVVNKVMNLWVPLNSGKLLSIYGAHLLKKFLFPEVR
jgi:hypothetical protein